MLAALAGKAVQGSTGQMQPRMGWEQHAARQRQPQTLVVAKKQAVNSSAVLRLSFLQCELTQAELLAVALALHALAACSM